MAANTFWGLIGLAGLFWSMRYVQELQTYQQILMWASGASVCGAIVTFIYWLLRRSQFPGQVLSTEGDASPILKTGQGNNTYQVFRGNVFHGAPEEAVNTAAVRIVAHPHSRYFSNPPPNGRLDLGMAIYCITDISDWQRNNRNSILSEQEQADFGLGRLHLGEVAAGLLRGQAETSQLTIYGRSKDSIVFEPVPADTWKLCKFRILADDRKVLRVEVVPQNDLDQYRLTTILSCDAFEIEIEQFIALWPGTKSVSERVAYVPMQEAATRAYETLRESRSVWAETADLFGGSSLGKTHSEGVLLYFANAFTTKNVPIYGKHMPSRKLEPIDPAEFRRGRFGENGGTFIYHTEKNPKYIDIAVKELDLAGAIERMKQDSSEAI
jgi:hypothetical protein